MKEKKCFKCGKTKVLSAFYKHKKMLDGHLNKCKDCTKSDTKERNNKMSKDPKWIEGERNRSREKYHRLGYKDKHKPTKDQKKAIMKRYAEKYPEKIAAKSKASNLKPEIKGNQLHHWSYNEQHYKDVIEYSVADHNTIHRHIIYDQERMMYRNLDGILLDTREKSIEYYNKILSSN